MTGVPEVVIANELKIPYASLCHVTNKGAGMQATVSQSEVNIQMEKSLVQTKAIINTAVEELL